MCTTVPPAKSIGADSHEATGPDGLRNPPPHTMWASGKYTAVAQMIENAIQLLNLIRSAIAPVISATVITAKVDWNATPTRAGTPREAPSPLSSVRLINPKYWNGLAKNWLIPVVALPNDSE